MSPPGRFAFVGNSLPRRCGIATFTTDLHQAIERLPPYEPCGIVAMNDHGRTYDYPPAVSLQIDDRRLGDYERAADVLNRARCEVVSLQHEFGIFGGEAGGHIMALAARLAMPLVTTLHTVLAQPTPAQRRALGDIVDASSRVVVMAEKGRELLRTVYQVAAAKIEVIPHGTPDCPFVEPDEAKRALGFDGRPVILTFGLLSPSKGIEVMIDAMPEVLESSPAAVYVVLGATHPNLIRDQGETYRSGLMARVRALGIEDHVVFLDRFVDQRDAAAFHLDVRCLRDSLSQRGAADIRHPGLQLRAGQGGYLDTLLARTRAVGRRARRARPIWRRRSARPRDCGIVARRAQAIRDARARLCGKQADDMAENRRTLPHSLRKHGEGRSPSARAATRRGHQRRSARP